MVRNSIRVNPATAQATVVSDPFPSILDGIPLQIRTVNVTLDRPQFTFNASCCTDGDHRPPRLHPGHDHRGLEPLPGAGLP